MAYKAVFVKTDDFLDAVKQALDQIGTLSFDWTVDAEQTYLYHQDFNAELYQVYQRGTTDTGVEYRVTAQDDEETRQNLMTSIERELQVADLISSSEIRLSLESIRVRKEDIGTTDGVPQGESVLLDYSD